MPHLHGPTNAPFLSFFFCAKVVGFYKSQMQSPMSVLHSFWVLLKYFVSI